MPRFARWRSHQNYLPGYRICRLDRSKAVAVNRPVQRPAGLLERALSKSLDALPHAKPVNTGGGTGCYLDYPANFVAIEQVFKIRAVLLKPVVLTFAKLLIDRRASFAASHAGGCGVKLCSPAVLFEERILN